MYTDYYKARARMKLYHSFLNIYTPLGFEWPMWKNFYEGLWEKGAHLTHLKFSEFLNPHGDTRICVKGNRLV